VACCLYDKIETYTYTMYGTHSGEIEEVVLPLAAFPVTNVCCVTVSRELETQTDRQVTVGRVHNTLFRLEEKGFVSSHLGRTTDDRGSGCKHLYTPTSADSRALQDIQELHRQRWQQLPAHLIKPVGI
jgi:hypothetical protein